MNEYDTTQIMIIIRKTNLKSSFADIKLDVLLYYQWKHKIQNFAETYLFPFPQNVYI